MQISTTARHCELDPEDRLFVQERLEKFARFARDISEIRLIITAEGYRHSAEITLRLKNRDMVSREVSTEPRKAIDLAADRLEEQLRRLKERRTQRHRGTRALNGEAGPAAGETMDGEDQAWEG